MTLLTLGFGKRDSADTTFRLNNLPYGVLDGTRLNALRCGDRLIWCSICRDRSRKT